MKNVVILLVVCCLLILSGGTNRATAAVHEKLSLVDDFSSTSSLWQQQEGEWVFDLGVVRQIATKDHYPLIFRIDHKFSNVDVSVDFKPISGRIDASGGLVFRAVDKDNYYLVRANALENNFRLYTFKKGTRCYIASAFVTPPSPDKFHTLRVVAKGDHIQVFFDGKLYIDHHDSSYQKGFVGLWTKADSVTEFDNLVVTELPSE